MTDKYSNIENVVNCLGSKLKVVKGVGCDKCVFQGSGMCGYLICGFVHFERQSL